VAYFGRIELKMQTDVTPIPVALTERVSVRAIKANNSLGKT
jgi:hypothetical protein